MYTEYPSVVVAIGQKLPPQAVVGSGLSYMVGRISYTCGFTGEAAPRIVVFCLSVLNPRLPCICIVTSRPLRKHRHSMFFIVSSIASCHYGFNFGRVQHCCSSRKQCNAHGRHNGGYMPVAGKFSDWPNSLQKFARRHSTEVV
jgi:hypothetical protein